MSGVHFGMFTTFYPPYNFGGDGIGVQRLARALVRRGHRVTVVHDADAYNALSPNPNPEPSDSSDSVEVVTLRSGRGTLSPILTQQLGRPVLNNRRLRALVQDRGFDVTWYHNVSLIGGPGLLQIGARIRIYEAHEHWLVCPTHVLWRHGKEVCTGRQCVRCVLRHRRPIQLWRYTNHLRRRLDDVDAFIAKSKFSRDKHREFGFPRSMEVIPYFLPPPEPRRPVSADESPHERPYFLFVGRLERIKGLDEVIPTFGDYPDADLLIAGDGEHGETLRGMAQDRRSIHFLGRVDPDQLARYYRHAIALIVPSVCFETFGIILIEAFRQGTPVIARRIGPFPEIVERCQGGELFDSRGELESALRRLQHNPQHRATLADNAMRGFVNHWAEPAVIPQYLQLVRGIALEKGLTETADKLNQEQLA